jgi:hypothetical protein
METGLRTTLAGQVGGNPGYTINLLRQCSTLSTFLLLALSPSIAHTQRQFDVQNLEGLHHGL